MRTWILISYCLLGWINIASAATPTTNPATVKVASIQCSSNLGDVAANRAKLTTLIEQAANNGAKIVVLPEACITGYLSQDLKTNWHLAGRPLAAPFFGKDPKTFAETVPGPSTDHFCALAGQRPLLQHRLSCFSNRPARRALSKTHPLALPRTILGHARRSRRTNLRHRIRPRRIGHLL
jgi:hypothetical protein